MGLIAAHFVWGENKISDKIAGGIAEWWNEPMQDDANAGLAFAKDRLRQAVKAALQRGELIPARVLKEAGY